MKLTLLGLFSMIYGVQAQTIEFEGKEFELSNVKASVEKLNGEEVLKVERDLEALSFDEGQLEATVDEPTYVKLIELDMENGSVEVKLLSKIQNPSPFQAAQGFIGLAFRISEDNSRFESIYLRPRVGRSENQLARNHTVQYFAYPDYKFQKLRSPAFQGRYETYADVGLEEWITFRIEFRDQKAYLYLNDQESAAFVVADLLGDSTSGSIGLWVDIGTIGYFKDLIINP
ncbi:MAG: hypothetical protein ABJH96_15480 [Algoriphagus sp.]